MGGKKPQPWTPQNDLEELLDSVAVGAYREIVDPAGIAPAGTPPRLISLPR